MILKPFIITYLYTNKYLILGPITYKVKELGLVSLEDCDKICKASSVCTRNTYDPDTEECRIFADPLQGSYS